MDETLDPELDSAMKIVSRRWALQIIGLLLGSPLRFRDLRQALPKISANILTVRLEELTGHGLILKRKLPKPADVQVYELTADGEALAGVIDALAAWTRRRASREAHLRTTVAAPDVTIPGDAT